MKTNRYIVQTKQENNRFTNIASYDSLSDAMLVKTLIESERNTKARILDRETKKYYF